MPDTRLKIAVFIDFDNIEIGVKNTLSAQFDIGVVLEALKERGEVVSKTAYGDWTRAGDYSRSLTQHATKLVQRNLTPGGDKNGADINLALDALEMAFTHAHINAYVIVGGDSDFISLVEKLKQYDKQVFIVGGRAFTSLVMQRNCHEFIAYENLIGGRRGDRGRSGAPAGQPGTIEQVVPLVRRALKVLSDREVSPQLGLLKSTLLQLDSTFSERTYGAGSFRDFAQKLADAGYVTLREHGRNVLVELRDGAPAPTPQTVGEPQPSQSSQPAQHAAQPHGAQPQGGNGSHGHAQPTEEQVANGVRDVRRLFQAAQNPPRWPMYVRQVKQFLRGVDPNFDERRYGFSSLNDLLRACQREGLFRAERDRQGAIRFFQGNVMKPVEGEEPIDLTEDAIQSASAEPRESEIVDGDVLQEIDSAPPVVDAQEAGPSEESPTEGEPADADASAEEGNADAAKPAKRRRAAKPKAAKAPREKKAAKPRTSRKKASTTAEQVG